MVDLIKIGSGTIGGGTGIQTVNGRDLHAFLEVKQEYTNWVKYQIGRCKFVEDRDYLIYANIGENSFDGETRGRKKIEHDFTLDAGKHIGMMSGTEKREGQV